MADWLDEIEAQMDETSPYYLPRLIAEIRRLQAEQRGAQPSAAASSGAPRQRSIAELRGVVSMLCHFIWHRKTRPGDHLWSIPVDPERDFDCILTDAIDELEKLRAEIRDFRAMKEEAEAKLAAAQEEIAQLSEELAANRACNLYTWKERAERAEQSLREKDAEIARLTQSIVARSGTEANNPNSSDS